MDDRSKSAQNNSLLKSRILWHHLNQVHLCVLKQFAFGPVLCCSCRHHPHGASVGWLSKGAHPRCQRGLQSPSRPQSLALQPCPLSPPFQPAHLTATAVLSRKGTVRYTNSCFLSTASPEEGTSSRGGQGPGQALSFQKNTWTSSIPYIGMMMVMAASFQGYHFLIEGSKMVFATVLDFSTLQSVPGRGKPWSRHMVVNRVDTLGDKGRPKF